MTDALDEYDDFEAEQGTQPQAAVVAESEAELIRLLRALILGNATGATGRLFRMISLPPAISSACERMLADALAQVWPALWRRSGALPITTADGERARRGRIWELRTPVGLQFSTVTLQLLRWLILSPPLPEPRTPRRGRRVERVREADEVGVDRIAVKDRWLGPAPTVGDQIIGYLALEATAGTPMQARIAAHWPVRHMALTWLAFPEAMSAEVPPELAAQTSGNDADAQAAVLAGMAGLTTGAGAVVVEALAGDLARRWRAIELMKRQITDPRALVALGSAQDTMLGAFMAACDQANRRELAAFVIDAVEPLLTRGLSPAPIALDVSTTLAIRAQARLAAGALLRSVVRWAAWDESHRGVRFMDDEYAASQLLLARFEPIGAAGTAQAATWLSDLAALPSG